MTDLRRSRRLSGEEPLYDSTYLTYVDDDSKKIKKTTSNPPRKKNQKKTNYKKVKGNYNKKSK